MHPCQTCDQTRQCPPGDSCDKKRCRVGHQRPECAIDAHCGNVQQRMCRRDTCQPKPTCTTPLDCPREWSGCEGGYCRKKQCNQGTPCPTGYYCKEAIGGGGKRLCEEILSCTQNHECRGDERCDVKKGRCVLGRPCAALGDDDCEPEYTCKKGLCRSRRVCELDSDCLGEDKCITSTRRCGCKTDTGCQTGFSCKDGRCTKP